MVDPPEVDQEQPARIVGRGIEAIEVRRLPSVVGAHAYEVALVAYHLAEEGVDTVLLDKRDVGTGSTAASTSLLQHEIDTELADLIGRVGEADAVRAYQLGIEAIDRVEELVMRLRANWRNRGRAK